MRNNKLESTKMNHCNKKLKEEGLAYPNTCRICMFGPCQFNPAIAISVSRSDTTENSKLFELIDTYLSYYGVSYRLIVDSKQKELVIIKADNHEFDSFNKFIKWFSAHK